jgi:N-acetyl-gamma-glutamyl-phosphate reductase
VFLALPEAASAELAPQLLARGRRVIDLSGAFRIRGDIDRKRWYPATAALPEGTVYGLSEGHQAEIAQGTPGVQSRLLSDGGALALEPLAAADVLAGPIVVDAKSGISGAGKAPSERTHFSENHGSVAAYGIFSHRHTAEIEQELSAPVTFVPHLVPLDRGILETIYAPLRPGTSAATISALLQAAYADAPFVRLTATRCPRSSMSCTPTSVTSDGRWTR